MEFQNNVALLYDSFVLNQVRSKLYSVLSFTGNAAYINALASDLINDFGLIEIEDADIKKWIDDAQRSVKLLALLGRLAESKDKIGIISYFVDKNYGLYLFLFGMLFPEIDKAGDDITALIEYVYKHYSKKTFRDDGAIDLKDNFEILNHYVKGLVYTQTEFAKYRPYYTDNSRKVEDLINALKTVYSDDIPDKLLSEFMFYSKDIVKKYQSLGVNDVRCTKNAGERLQSAVHLMTNCDSISFSFIHENDNKDNVRKLVVILLKLVEYNMCKLYDTRDVKGLTENERYLFVIVWTLFQGKKNEWMFSKEIFHKIRDLFESVKKELNV